MSDLGSPLAETGLDARQMQMLELLRAGKAVASSEQDSPINPASGAVPLTPDQIRVWFFARAFPQSAEYNQPLTLRFAQWPGRKCAEGALKALIERHDALRLHFFERQGEPLQALSDAAEVPLGWLDLSALPTEVATHKAVAAASSMVREPFDPAQAPLVRALAVGLPDGGGLLALSIHHLVADGASIEILAEELVALMKRHDPGLPPPVRFIDYADWRRRTPPTQNLERARSYWREKLAGELPVLEVPGDRPRPDRPSRIGHTVGCRLDAELVKRLQTLAGSLDATLFMVLLAAYKVLLMRLSGQTDVIVGTPLLGRDRLDCARVVGMFVNTVPLRTARVDRDAFRQLVQSVRDTVVEAQDHSALSFDRIVAEANVSRGASRSPLIQTMFGFGGLPRSLGAEPAVNDLVLDTFAAKWELTLFLDHDGEGVSGQLEYAADLYDAATAARFVEIFQTLCEAFADDPERDVATVSLSTPDQRRHVLEDLNPYAVPVTRYATMAQPFEEQVVRSPDAIALETCDGRTISYSELNAAANRLAHWLLGQGVGPGSRIGICMARSPELILAIYAAVKTGATYVPFDPELPDDRLRFMRDDIEPAITLVHADTADRIEWGRFAAVDLDCRMAWSEYPDTNPPCIAPAQRPVHYLYTSGTTGRPKAVVYPVDAALAEIFWLHSKYPSLGRGDTNIFLTSFGFDVSIWEIFWTLYFGARMIIPAPGDQRSPPRIAELVTQYRPTTLFLIPGLLDAVLSESAFAEAPCLRWVFCGGAPVSARLRDRFHALKPATMLLNCYGPTEAGAVTDMALPREPGNPVVPLGRPANNFRLYVLDRNLEPCPIGIPGEVYLGGCTGIALGYHKRSALTAERFLPDPFDRPGGRMYRTGDLCRYRADGVLEHLGRADRQVKVRGMRIEPAEIEAVVSEHPAVAQCHVLVPDTVGRAGHLPAFVTLRAGANAEPRDLRRHAARLLPAHMLPTSIQVLDRLPINVNGKFDQSALLELAEGSDGEGIAPPSPPETAEQEAILEIFRAVTGCADAGVDDDFFAVGGHSLLLFRLINRFEENLGWQPGIAEIFAMPTVRQMAEAMLQGGTGLHHLVPLAAAPSRPMVVLIHPAGGSVLPFADLARALSGEFSVWGLQAPQTDKFEDWSIRALAAAYSAELDSERSLSPVILVGWSMGGCIALEIARLMQTQGRPAAAVMLLDTWVPPMTHEERTRERLAAALHAVDVLDREGTASAGLDLDTATLERLQSICRRNIEAFATYEPAYLDMPIDYLRAVEMLDSADTLQDALGDLDDRGWGAFAAAIAVHPVPGSHFTLVAKENASALAAIVRGVIQTCLGAEEI